MVKEFEGGNNVKDMDVHDSSTRSYNMSQIKGKDTRPELIVRKFLHVRGFRYSLHSDKLQGKPDIKLEKYKTIIDVRGCFWHMHQNCRYGNVNSKNFSDITAKRIRAAKNDPLNANAWEVAGYKVIIIWADCQLEPKRKYSKLREKTLNWLLSELNKISN